jgi:RNA polymerase sigma-70 factor, ECF subfamily
MEAEIQRLIAAGCSAPAFELLLEGFRNKVFRLMYAMLRNQADAEDAAQDTFLKIWRALPGYDGRASLSTWIYTIARNTALTRLRSDSYRAASPLTSEPAAPSPGPESRRPELDIALDRLPAEQRAAISLFYFEERSIEEVSAMLGMPPGTVKSHLHRARKVLAQLLEVNA